MKSKLLICKSEFICYFAVIALAGIIAGLASGCSTVPPEQEGSSIPWAQPEQWENSQLKTGVGF